MVIELRENCSLLSPRIEQYLKTDKFDDVDCSLTSDYEIECVRAVFKVKEEEAFFYSTIEKLEKNILGKRLKAQYLNDPDAFFREPRNYGVSMYDAKYTENVITTMNLNGKPKGLLTGIISKGTGLISDTNACGHFTWWIGRNIEPFSYFKLEEY